MTAPSAPPPRPPAIPAMTEWPDRPWALPPPRLAIAPANLLYAYETTDGERRRGGTPTSGPPRTGGPGSLLIEVAPEFIGTHSDWLDAIGMVRMREGLHACNRRPALAHFMGTDERVLGHVAMAPALTAPTLHIIDPKAEDRHRTTSRDSQDAIEGMDPASIWLHGRRWATGIANPDRPAYCLLGSDEILGTENAARALDLAGWVWRAETNAWTTTEPSVAMSMAAYATPAAAARLAEAGLPTPMMPFLRHAPTLLPGRRDWLLLAAERAVPKHLGPPPELAHTDHRRTRLGYRIRGNDGAARLLNAAARPLGYHLLQAARANVLNEIAPHRLNLHAVPGDPNGEEPGRHRADGGAQPGDSASVCDRCNAIIVPAGTATDGSGTTCADPGCPNTDGFRGVGACLNPSDATLARVQNRADAAGYRRIAFRLAEADAAQNRRPIDTGVRDILVPEGRTLIPLQRETLDWCLGHRTALNANPTGSGKTITTLLQCKYEATVAHRARRRWRGLLVVPAALVPQWLERAHEWLEGATSIHAMTTRTNPAKSGTHVISYEGLKANRRVQEAPWNLVVVDEAHSLKNPGAQRTKAAMALETDHMLFLTATPIYNRPDDLFPMLQRAFPRAFKSFRPFRRAFGVRNPAELSEDNRSMLDELSVFLREHLMFRADPNVILRHLPERAGTKLVLANNDGGDDDECRTNVSQLEHEVIERFRVDGVITTASVLPILSELRQTIARAKLDRTSELMELLREGAKPYLVFTEHREAATDLVERARTSGGRVGLILGGDGDARTRAVREFQAGQLDGLVATYKSAGVGLDLQRARAVVMHELSWTPSDHTQAEARAHRHGQTHPVETYYVVLEDTIDAHVAGMLSGKGEMATTGLGDDAPASDWRAMGDVKGRASATTTGTFTAMVLETYHPTEGTTPDANGRDRPDSSPTPRRRRREDDPARPGE